MKNFSIFILLFAVLGTVCLSFVTDKQQSAPTSGSWFIYNGSYEFDRSSYSHAGASVPNCPGSTHLCAIYIASDVDDYLSQAELETYFYYYDTDKDFIISDESEGSFLYKKWQF